MLYTNLGNTGLIVSRLTFGAMTFGKGRLVGDLFNDIDQQTADRMVGIALDSGVNCFDTADMYTSGQSESMLGKALKGKRDGVVICTKCGFRSGEPLISSGLSYGYILKAVEGSLSRLGTDYIDIFQLHVPDPVTPMEETVRALDYVVGKGWVRYVGYSNYPAWMAQRLLDIVESNGLSRLISAQMYYSLLGRDIENEVVPFLEANGLGLMVWSPLAGGFLTGKYTRENPVPSDGRRTKFNFPPVDVDRGYAVVNRLIDMAQSLHATPSRLAIAWLLEKPHVSTVIIGANNLAQLEDNLKAADLVLLPEDMRDLDALTATPLPYPVWMLPMGLDAKSKEALAIED
ncbi:MAG: aldo/keto reductase [Nitrospirae bacterium]|nr:aldo/keto reductase [Nitrospirota bacterium]